MLALLGSLVGIVKAGVEYLLGVIIGCKELLRPSDGYLLGKSPLSYLIAHSHHVLVVAARLKLDACLGQLGRNEGVIICLYALHLFVFLALLGVGGGSSGYLLGGKHLYFAEGAQEYFWVVGKSAQAGDVLALRVGLDA